MYCAKCGAPLNGAAVCNSCGTAVVAAPAPSQPTATPVEATPNPTPTFTVPPVQPGMVAQKTNVLAIVGLVLSIVGCGANWIGIVFGAIALGQIKKSQGLQGGRGMALAAVIVGIVMTVFQIGLGFLSIFSSGFSLPMDA